MNAVSLVRFVGFVTILGLLFPPGVRAGEEHAHENAPAMDWFTGEGVSLGGILFPHIHAVGVTGMSTADPIPELAVGHHDPQNTFTLQALELGVSLRAGEYLRGFAVYSAFTDPDGALDGEFEEAFLKLEKLPGGLELRGGRFYNRFGFQAAEHNHAWGFVNQNLANGRMLREGELVTEGGEITWNPPTPFRSAISLSLGRPLKEDHEHEHGEEAEFEAEGSNFDDYVAGVNLLARLDYNDFYQNTLTLSAAWGDNDFGRTTQIYGTGYQYQWRANGYEPGGAYLRWTTELFYRNIGAESGGHEHEHEHAEEHHAEKHSHAEGSERATFDEFGFYSSAAYGFNEHIETGLRAGWVSGIDEMGLDSRWRISPNLTVSLNEQRTVYVRLQYDFDHSSDWGAEHSLWFQLGFNWGGPEVR